MVFKVQRMDENQKSEKMRTSRLKAITGLN
jgi:hypothetical protein